jgi:hypothetical protein
MPDPASTAAAVRAAVAASSATARWWRRRGNLPSIDPTVDRAIGDPGWCITVTNRLTLPITAVEWGVMRASDAPTRGRRVIVMPEEPRPSGGYGRASYAALSVWGSGPVTIEPLGRKFLKAGVDAAPESDEYEARQALYRDDSKGLVGWVRIDAVGVIFSPRKSSDGARSDLRPIMCRCRHPHWSHETRVASRRRWRVAGRRMPVYVLGSCSGWEDEGCTCTRFRLSKSLTADPLRAYPPQAAGGGRRRRFSGWRLGRRFRRASRTDHEYSGDSALEEDDG